jgi:cell division protein FtsI/penicillin-binding protein 2
MAMAYACLANDGVLMRPYVIARAVDSNTGGEVETRPHSVRRVVREEVADEVVSMLTSVVEDEGGTGYGARVPGLLVAGKTGTAEKFVDGEYSKDRYVVSFAGMIPAEAPEYVILVVVDEPVPEAAYGGMIAAPAFRDIADTIATLEGLPRTQPETELATAPR